MKVDLDGKWTNLNGEINDRPAYIRVNNGLSPVAGSKEYGHEQILSVKLKHPDERGMPSDVELESLSQFEDSIRPVLQEGMESLLTVVMTTDGFRDFIFYTRDPDSAFRRLQTLEPSFKSIQLDVQGRPDTNWTQFRRFAKNTA